MTVWAIPQHPKLRWRYLWPDSPAGQSLPVPARTTVNLFWARNAIFHGLQAIGLARNATVLVPSYICRSVPEAVAATGASIDFYRVCLNGQIDLEDLQRRIRAGARAVIAVHYFGSMQESILGLRKHCDQHGVFLIEDCAHVLTSPSGPQPTGTVGHLSVISWRKFLPVYDGATLSIDTATVKYSLDPRTRRAGTELRSAKDVLDRWCTGVDKWSPRSTAAAEAVNVGLTALVPPSRLAAAGKAVIDPNSDSYSEELVSVSMTRSSEWILRRSNLQAIVAARRSNWLVLHEAVLQSGRMQPLKEQLDAGAGPWAFALRFPGLSDAHLALRRLGIPAATWGGVRPQQLPRDLHPEAEMLYRDLVFLPVHQDLSDADLRFMTDAMRQVAESLPRTRAS